MDNNELEKYRMFHRVLVQRKAQDPIGKAMAAIDIKQENSKNVVLFIGKYIKDGDREGLTYDDNFNADYNKYIDIETSYIYNVKLSDVEEFEKSHTVIKRKVRASNMILHNENYNEVRREFFTGILDDSQENVILSLKQ